MKETKKKILIFTDYYLPGYKAGGPIRSVSNMVKILNDNYSFLIITRDRDQLDQVPYNYIRVNEWDSRNQVEICYTNSALNLRRLLSQKEFDIYYLNSLFSFRFSIRVILMRKLRLIPVNKVILAPRGQLSSGALSLKLCKKKVLLVFAKILRLYTDVIWQASSKYEADDIRKAFGKSAEVRIAVDVPAFNIREVQRNEKQKDYLRILFIAGITRIKNLKFVIEILKCVKGDFILDIYGPIKDKTYWKTCQGLISPEISHRVNYKGFLDNNLIQTIYPNYDVFFFPTRGENFGHVIYESLTYRTPVLCSDKTPWDKLTHFNAGWTLSLDRTDDYIKIIENLICLDQDSFQRYVKGCKEYIDWFWEECGVYGSNRDLFQ